jgi:hypothetical protein
MSIKRRLEALERHAAPSGFVVFWEDPDREGVFFKNPYSDPNRGREYSEAEIQETEAGKTIIFVVYREREIEP